MQVVQATMNKEIGYDYAVDIWSLGCTIIEMFTGKHPWIGLEGVINIHSLVLFYKSLLSTEAFSCCMLYKLIYYFGNFVTF